MERRIEGQFRIADRALGKNAQKVLADQIDPEPQGFQELYDALHLVVGKAESGADFAGCKEVPIVRTREIADAVGVGLDAVRV